MAIAMSAAPKARPRWVRAVLPAAFLLLVVVGLGGRFLAPHDPSQVELGMRYIEPFRDLQHLLGTDQLGRDILSRTLTGASLSLAITTLVIASAGTIGIGIGLAAGFLGGRTDEILMRLTDAMLALPAVMIALFLVAVIGAGFWSVVAALMLVTWARYARFVRGEVLSLRSMDFIDAAIVCATPTWMILWRHFLPNVINAVVVLLTLDIGRVILLESSLAFLGLGLSPEQGAWGSTIAEGKQYLQTAPWIPLTPAVAMMVTIMLANSFGNWLSDELDPKLRAAA
jgi:peptide/nickel transport system permease protein